MLKQFLKLRQFNTSPLNLLFEGGVAAAGVFAFLFVAFFLFVYGANPATKRKLESIQFSHISETHSEPSKKINNLKTAWVEVPVLIEIDKSALKPNAVLFFRSKHAEALSCELSNNTLERKQLVVRPLDSGYIAQIPNDISNALAIRCSISSKGPANITVERGDPDQFVEINLDAERNAGVVEGAFLALAGFCVLVSLAIRQPIYLLFAAWLVLNMRVGSITLGVDNQFLSVAIPKELQTDLRKFAISGYFVTTIALFFKIVFDRVPIRLAGLTGPVLKILAVVMICNALLPYRVYLPVMWICAAIAIASIVSGLVSAYIERPGKILLWYGLSWGITYLGILVEIAAAALGFPLNGVLPDNATGSIVSSIICALCLAEKVNESEAQRAISQQEAQNALARFTKTYNGVPVGLLTLDNKTDLVTRNSYSEKIFKGFPKAFEEFLGRAKKEWASVDSKVSDDTLPKIFKFQVNEHIYEASSVRDGTLIELTVSDITEKEIASEKLKRLAHRDPLTELYNRFRIIELLDRRLANMGNIVVPLDCVGLFDIDGFDRTVTHFGHKAGDEVLVEYVRRIKEALPASTTIGRLSADTIIAVLPDKGLRSTQYAVQAALDAINGQPFATSSLQLSIKASAGLCLIEGNITCSELLATCDSALQDAKLAGGGRVMAYSEKDPAWLRHKAEQQLMANFMRSIPFDDFRIFFQPIVDLKSSQPGLRYEALVRMFDHNGRLVSPAQFLPALEKAGLMSTVDLWIVRNVINYLKANSEHFAALECASVNLSGASLNDERFTETMLALAQEHPQIVRKLCFEITEDVALKDFESTRRFISRVKAIGARIALDDFGAGYSSFAYLTQLQIDSVKIDGSLIRGLHLNGSKQAIVKAIVDLCRALNNKVVSEWVETPEELITLRNLGVDAVQGYLVGRPTDSAQAKNWTGGNALVTDPVVKQIIANTKSASAVNVI